MTPVAYTPSTDFGDDEAGSVSGRSTVRTQALDTELQAISLFTQQVISSLTAIQRADGALLDGIVTLGSLSASVLTLITAAGGTVRGAWLTATAYAIKDVVSNGTGTYIAATAHTSGVFATDLAAGKWVRLFDSSAFIASSVAFTPTGSVSSSNVQAAIAEVDSEKLAKSQNLSDVADVPTSRANLGLGVIATRSSIGAVDLALAALGFSMFNGTLVPNVNTNALTVSIKTAAGNDPSAADPVLVVFRNGAAGTGDYSVLTLTAATSITLSSGSTIGTTASTAFRGWVVGFNDANTFRMGIVNCLSGVGVMALRDDVLASSTAEGGAGAADSAQVIYTGTAVAGKPMRVLGYFEYSAGLGTAGAYNVVPTKMQLFGPGINLPGEIVQVARKQDSAVTTGSTLLPYDDTIPQNTEGFALPNLDTTLTPTSAANLLEIDFGTALSSSALNNVSAAIFRDATANALAAVESNNASADYPLQLHGLHSLLSGAVASTTFKLRVGGASAATITVNGQVSARKFGGVFNSYMKVTEVMA